MNNLYRWAITFMLIFALAGPAFTVDEQAIWARFELSQEAKQPRRISREMSVSIREPGPSGGGPVMDISLWRGECRMKIRLGEKTAFGSVLPDNAGVRLGGDAVTHLVYHVQSGLEWEITLNDKPVSHILGFEMEAENLVFFRQDSLSDFEKSALRAQRPDSVTGAWVAYHRSKAHNRCIISGDDTTYYDYGTGQAFIIYRPRAWDADDTVWCELTLDSARRQLVISIDPVWLESASYPITIDPTFGNTSVGGSTLAWNQSYAYCHTLFGTNTYTVPSNKVGTITGYSVYGCETGAGDLGASMTAFNIGGSNPVNRVGEPSSVSVSGGTPGWFSGTAAHGLASGTEYGVAVSCAPRAGGTIYYNSVTGATATDNTHCDLGSEQWTNATVTNFNLSMYATFTEEEMFGAKQTRRRRFTVIHSNGGVGQ